MFYIKSWKGKNCLLIGDKRPIYLFAFFFLFFSLTLLFRTKRNAIELPDTLEVEATQNGGHVLANVFDEGDVFFFVHLRPCLVIEDAVVCVCRRDIEEVVQRRQEFVNLESEADKYKGLSIKTLVALMWFFV